MTLIGVKSKYGSCNGNCTGVIKFNIFFRIFLVQFQNKTFIRKGPYVGLRVEL